MAGSLEEEKVEEEKMESKELERALPSTNYSLSSSPAPSSFSRSSSYVSSRRWSSCHKSPWQQVEQVDLENHDELPSVSPSDHIKTLLSQLVSGVSSMKGAFTHLQATLRAYSSVEGSVAVPSPAEKVMVEELQRLSSLHTRLYCVLHEQGALKEDGNGSPDMCGGDAQSMLKSYEGIISRFHDEIRKKDALVEALKETLAKSMLKAEKLERRLKSLEANNLSLK